MLIRLGFSSGVLSKVPVETVFQSFSYRYFRVLSPEANLPKSALICRTPRAGFALLRVYPKGHLDRTKYPQGASEKNTAVITYSYRP
jgi:hypothetical protein